MIGYSRCTYTQLRQFARERGINPNQKVNVLIELLKDWDRKNDVDSSICETHIIMDVKPVEKQPTNGVSFDDFSSFATSINSQKQVTQQPITEQPVTIETTQTTVTSESSAQETPVKPVAKRATHINEIDNETLEKLLSKCLIHFNNEKPLENSDKPKVWRYVLDVIAWFEKHEPSRLITGKDGKVELPGIAHLSEIDLLMKPYKHWVYGTDSDMKTERSGKKQFRKDYSKRIDEYNKHIEKELQAGKNRDNVEVVATWLDKVPTNPKWNHVRMDKKSTRARLTRTGNDWEVGMISPPTKQENSATMNGKASEISRYQMYEHKPIIDKSKDLCNPERIKYSNHPELCTEVQHLRINGKFIISGVTKLSNKELEQGKAKLEKVAKGKETTKAFKSGLLANWSLPFSITLDKTDFMYDEKQPTGLYQICLEQDRVVLYRLGKTYQKYFAIGETKSEDSINYLIGKSAIQANSHALVQDRQRVAEIGKVIINTFPVYQWIATQPKYEFIAKSLTSSHRLPKDIDKQYMGIVVSEDIATLRNIALCKKQYLGERSMCKVIMTPTIAVGNKAEATHEKGNLKPQYVWIDGLLKTTERKMITNNSQAIAEKLGNDKLSADQQDELHDKKKNIKTLLSTVRKHTRRLNPDMLDATLVEISSTITEFLCQNNISRSDIVGMMQKLTYDDYLKLRDRAITYHNSKDGNHLIEVKENLLGTVITSTGKKETVKTDNALILFK